MERVDILRSLPKTKRNVSEREGARDESTIRVAQQYGQEYFDGDRKFGYGGYHYDGRWKSVVVDMIKHFNLQPGSRVLDIGCAKGYLVLDFHQFGMKAFGVDVSEYALANCPDDMVGYLHRASAVKLPFPDKSFDCVVSLNTLHNLDRHEVVWALKEINRVVNNPRKCFVQVDSYNTREEKELFERWVLTAEFHGYPDEWLDVFKAAGYQGDYDWTLV